MILGNTNLEIPSQASVIAKDTTLIGVNDNAAISIPEDTAIVSKNLNTQRESSYIGTFIAPVAVALSSAPAVNLTNDIDATQEVESVYKFGSDTTDKALYAKKGDLSGNNQNFTIYMVTKADVGKVVDVYYSQDGITWTLFT